MTGIRGTRFSQLYYPSAQRVWLVIPDDIGELGRLSVIGWSLSDGLHTEQTGIPAFYKPAIGDMSQGVIVQSDKKIRFVLRSLLS